MTAEIVYLRTTAGRIHRGTPDGDRILTDERPVPYLTGRLR